MVSKSVRKRLKINKKGKVKHRSQGLGHNRSKWDSDRRSRKLNKKEFGVKEKKVKELINQ